MQRLAVLSYVVTSWAEFWEGANPSENESFLGPEANRVRKKIKSKEQHSERYKVETQRAPFRREQIRA